MFSRNWLGIGEDKGIPGEWNQNSSVVKHYLFFGNDTSKLQREIQKKIDTRMIIMKANTHMMNFYN